MKKKKVMNVAQISSCVEDDVWEEYLYWQPLDKDELLIGSCNNYEGGYCNER
jgi:hypothetical protein